MCALTTAFDFSTDMIKLSAATLGQLLEIQLEDLATFVAHQSAAVNKVSGVHDVAGLLALQREYRDAFWNDRLKALVATRKTFQVAMEQVGQRFRDVPKEVPKEVPREMPKEVASVPPALETPTRRSRGTRAKTSAPAGTAPKTRTRARAAKKAT
jgi:hypothetical protein